MKNDSKFEDGNADNLSHNIVVKGVIMGGLFDIRTTIELVDLDGLGFRSTFRAMSGVSPKMVSMRI